MTRQMADDEVLRVLDRCVRCAAVGANPHYAGWHDDMTRSHEYVAALQAERDALRACDESMQQTNYELHQQIREHKAALEALRGQVAGLVAAADAITFDTYALTAPETRAAFDGRDSVAVVRIDTLDAFRAELLEIKERMG